jgi:ABC-type branched-subunit amino acid transport system ATPase component
VSATQALALLAEGITSGYTEVPIIRNVSVSVAHSEIVTIIGPNGAGKSTLLKTIFGFLRARTGRVVVDGAEVTGMPPERLVRRGLAFVPQTDNVFGSLSVRENLTMGGFTLGGEMEQRIERVLGLFPLLSPRLRERADRLSGGQRQTLALARALMLDPTVLLLDEPSASLSPVMVESVFSHVAAINGQGTAVLMIEQNARHALAISHRGYVLANGENRLEGPAAELLQSDDVRRLYLGE